ncbi:helix-turn-helix domain-containing protein [Roseibium alexandrii]
MITIQTQLEKIRKLEKLGEMEKHERLRAARQKAGYRSAAAAADALGMSHSTYQAHENSNRNFDAEDAARYARRFKVTTDWLLYGGEMPQDGSDEYSPDEQFDHVDLADTPFDDIERFKTAYREAKRLEKAKIGGRGDRLSFARLVWAIYDELGGPS